MVVSLFLTGLLLLWIGRSSGRHHARLAATQGIAAPGLKWISRISLAAAALMLVCAAGLFLLAVASW